MTTLSKFYDLLHKNVTCTLCDPSWSVTYYEGPLKSIPDEYDGWIVVDFAMSDSGDMLFEIKKEG